MDIVTNKQVIEIKSGKNVNVKQLAKHVAIANALNKSYICYCPKLKRKTFKSLKNKYNLTKRKDDIITIEERKESKNKDED